MRPAATSCSSGFQTCVSPWSTSVISARRPAAVAVAERSGQRQAAGAAADDDDPVRSGGRIHLSGAVTSRIGAAYRMSIAYTICGAWRRSSSAVRVAVHSSTAGRRRFRRHVERRPCGENRRCLPPCASPSCARHALNNASLWTMVEQPAQQHASRESSDTSARTTSPDRRGVPPRNSAMATPAACPCFSAVWMPPAVSGETMPAASPTSSARSPPTGRDQAAAGNHSGAHGRRRDVAQIDDRRDLVQECRSSRRSRSPCGCAFALAPVPPEECRRRAASSRCNRARCGGRRSSAACPTRRCRRPRIRARCQRGSARFRPSPRRLATVERGPSAPTR